MLSFLGISLRWQIQHDTTRARVWGKEMAPRIRSSWPGGILLPFLHASDRHDLSSLAMLLIFSGDVPWFPTTGVRKRSVHVSSWPARAHRYEVMNKPSSEGKPFRPASLGPPSWLLWDSPFQLPQLPQLAIEMVILGLPDGWWHSVCHITYNRL